MAEVVVGVGASHTTLMNTKWAEVDHLARAHDYRNALHTARAVVAAADADVAVVVGSNHFRGFWLDLMPTFTVGVGEVLAAGEHGTPEGPQAVDPEFAQAVLAGLTAAEFDVAFSARLQVDHGITHAIQHVLPAGLPVVPLVVNCFAPPLPSLRRCAALGDALAAVLAATPLARRVAVVGSGGLSHQLPFPDWRRPESDDDEYLVRSWLDGRGDWARYEERRREIVVSAPPRLAEGFDADVLDRLTAGTLAGLIDEPADELVAIAGNGANELRTWIVMAAACGWAPGRTLCYSPMPEWLTGMAVAVIEPSWRSPATQAAADRSLAGARSLAPQQRIPMTAWTDLTPIAYSVDYVDAAGIATRTLRAGDGPDVVFLHGTSGHLEAFTRNIVAHVEAGFRCHAIDMLGHGYTAGLDHPYEIPDYVAHLLAYLDAAGVERANLAGESLGGWVAAWLASEHPERVITLQLIAAGGTKANPEVMERIRTSTKRAVSTDDRELTRKRLELLMHDPAIVSDELVDVRHRIYHRPEFVANVDNLLCLQDMQTRQRNLLTSRPAGHARRHPDADHLGPPEPLRRRARGPADARAHPQQPSRAVPRVRPLAPVRARRPVRPDGDRVPPEAQPVNLTRSPSAPPPTGSGRPPRPACRVPPSAT